MRQASERVGKRVANALANFVPAIASPTDILAANDV